MKKGDGPKLDRGADHVWIQGSEVVEPTSAQIWNWRVIVLTATEKLVCPGFPRKNEHASEENTFWILLGWLQISPFPDMFPDMIRTIAPSGASQQNSPGTTWVVLGVVWHPVAPVLPAGPCSRVMILIR